MTKIVLKKYDENCNGLNIYKSKGAHKIYMFFFPFYKSGRHFRIQENGPIEII